MQNEKIIHLLRSHRRMLLYRATQHMHPAKRWVVRKIGLPHFIVVFLLSIPLYGLQMTGAIIGTASVVGGVIGIFFFVLILSMLSLIGYKRHLIRRMVERVLTN